MTNPSLPSLALGALLLSPATLHAQPTAEARAALARLGVDQRQITLTLRPGAKPSYHIRIRNGT